MLSRAAHDGLRRGARGAAWRAAASAVAARGVASQASAAKLQLHDVTPRDGIQNEKHILTLAERVELVKRVLSVRPNSVEVTSFVRGDLVPAMAGAAELVAMLGQDADVRRARAGGVGMAALIPNVKGFETMHKANSGLSRSEGEPPLLDTAVVLVSCSDSHSKANVNRPMRDALKATLDIIKLAKEQKYKVRAYASLAFGCPFEGRVPESTVLSIVHAYAEAGADWICLADTLGVGTPEQVQSLVRQSAEVVPVHRLAMHLHDSHRRAHENVRMALRAGVRSFDAAVGGCGGCNFAPGSAGNISVEKLLRAARLEGVAYDVDEEQLASVNARLQEMVRRPLETLHTLPAKERLELEVRA